jgi:hypothetical protein
MVVIQRQFEFQHGACGGPLRENERGTLLPNQAGWSSAFCEVTPQEQVTRGWAFIRVPACAIKSARLPPVPTQPERQ